MVKTPRTRHSKTRREPLTIDLDSKEVSRSSGPEETTEILDLESPETRAGVGEAAAEASSPETGSAGDAGEPIAGEPVAEDPGASAGASDGTPAESAPEEGPATDDGEWRQARLDPGPNEPPGRQPDVEPAAAAAPSPGRVRVVAAGVLGGLVALAAGGLLQFGGLLGTPGGGAGPGLDGVETEIASLKAEIAELRDRPAGPVADPGTAGRVDGLARAVDQLGTELASLRESAGSQGGGDGAAVSELERRIGEVETSLAGVGRSPGSGEDVSAMNERIAGVDALVKAAAEADAAFDARLGAVEQSVSELATRVEAQAAQPEIALAIAAAALKSAIERGEPFEAEIETFAAVAPEAPEIAGLRAHAAAGVATRAELLAGTESAAEAIIRAADPPPSNAGFFERLLDSAESLVTVRPIGAVEGEGVPETVARMEVAMQAGDLEKAIAEYDTLPDVARAAGAELAERIRARLEVERLADQAIASAMKV